MPNDAVPELLNRQRQRVLAAILAVKDECDEYLPRELKFKMRRVVLDEVNGLVDFVLDVVRALDDESVAINELWLERVAERAIEIGAVLRGD
jgi:hypothetical protein